MLTEQGDEFALKSVRSALKAMHRPQMIGKHPLASLQFVRARHNKSGRPADLPSLGITMREILRDAIEALRPVGFRPVLI